MKKVRLINVSQNKDISDYIDNLEISMPNIKEISSMVAKFNLEEKLIQNNDEISISVLDEAGNTIYNLTGKARLQVETLNYTNLHGYNYEVKESYSNLFEKVISETQVFYDLYLCNSSDTNNSLMHIIARNLGFKNLEFHNALYENGQYIRIPFVIFRENEKWIDELQSLIAATNSVLYITAGKLFFKVNDFTLNNNVIFDKTNIITRISKSYKATENNGVKVLYDRYKKLENQVVFNLKSKIKVEKNTNKDTEVKSMKINYITSSVADPTITKATGYYFRTHGDVNSKVDIDLVRNTHYVLEEFTETQAIVKFYNPLNYDLIIDNFEIKGTPLVMYTDNSVIVKKRSVTEKNQENFSVVNKNKYVQTPELAENIAKQIYRSSISSKFSYNLDTKFIHNLELGYIYALNIEDISARARLTSYTMQFRTSDFRLNLKIDEIGTVDNIAISYTDSLNSNSQYIDLSNVEKSIEENKQELKTIKSSFESLAQNIEDSRTKIYTLKPQHNTLTDSNIGDMYISSNSAEILVKENNNLVWKPITDNSVRSDLNEYIKSNNAKVIEITYQNTEPKKAKNGDIWIDTGNDGIWKRYDGTNWVQIDESIRTAITTANSNISKIEKKITTINNTIDNKILAKAFVQEAQPTSGMKNHDIWYNPKANTFKKWLNNKWNNASEDDIFPSLRHYVSLATAQLDIGKRIDGVNEKAGMFLTNNNTKFGAKNGTLAEVSLAKTGEILLKNANNLLQWNVKDPTNPNKINSQILMGVTDVNDPKWKDVIFAIGDEASPSRLLFRNGTFNHYIGGQELGAKLNNVDRNINNLSAGINSSLNTAKSYADTKKNEAINSSKGYTDTKKTEIDRNINNLSKGISDSLNTAKGYADTKKTEAINTSKSYADTKKNEAIASSKSYADTKIIEEKERNSLLALMSTGKMIYTDPEFKSGINDIKIYNNAKPNNVITHTRALKQKTDALYPPNTSGYVIEIKNAGTINNTTVHPGAGGFYFATASRKEAIFITRIVARIPVGWRINFSSNATGGSRVEKWLTSQNGTGKYEEYIFYLKCGNSTNASDYSSTNFFYLSHTTNHYQAMTWYLAYATVYDCVANKDEKLYEIDRRLTNADGKLTQLQQNYQDTVKDVTNFKTRTASEIDTVQGALRNGNFVITGNTSFDGSARFVSRGTNEVITIADGSIDFHRDGKKLTRIKNSRYGTIATDSKGKGVVNFEGFKQPMILLTSIKSANFGKNMASIFCYAEHIRDCMYRIFVGGTNEHYVEAKPIKVVGTEWRADNAITTELLGISGNAIGKVETDLPYIAGRNEKRYFRVERGQRYTGDKVEHAVVRKNPKFKVNIKRNSETIFSKEYTMKFSFRGVGHGRFPYTLSNVDFSSNFNLIKKFDTRNNIKYTLEIVILEKDLLIDFELKGHTGHNPEYTNIFVGISPLFTLTPDMFKNLSITASATTSTLSGVTGEGEVQYIAMEIE